MVIYKLQLFLTASLFAIVNFAPVPPEILNKAETTAPRFATNSPEILIRSVSTGILNETKSNLSYPEFIVNGSSALKFRKQIVSSEAYETECF